MVFTDATEPGNPIIFTNDSFLALIGYGREKVLGQRFDVPFIFATGYSAQDMREGYGERPLLKKPIRYAELAAVFANLLSWPSGALEA